MIVVSGCLWAIGSPETVVNKRLLLQLSRPDQCTICAGFCSGVSSCLGYFTAEEEKGFLGLKGLCVGKVFDQNVHFNVMESMVLSFSGCISFK